MKKKYLIFGGLVALVAAFFYWKKKQPLSADEILDQSMDEAGKTMGSLYTANQSAVDPSQYTIEDNAYNDAVRRYQLKYKRQPDKSWTTEQIEQRIADYEEIMSYIAEYSDLVEKYMGGKSEYTSVQLGNMNATELKILVQRTSSQSKKAIWNARKEDVERIVRDFQENFTQFGTWAGDAKPYDLNTADALLALPKNEKIYANSYFSKIGGVVTAENWFDYNDKNGKKWVAKTISGAIMKDSVFRDRAAKNTNKQEAMNKMNELRQAYANVNGALNDFGEIV